jgi:DNA sulfur modification protein DndC
MIETSLAKMRKCATDRNLNIEAHLVRPPAEQSFWVNIIGRGYPPPNRVFRWCTQRMKIDPVTRFVEQRMGRWGKRFFIWARPERRAPPARKRWPAGKPATD